MKEGEGPDLLKDLLEAGVITQEEYDTLAAAREANKPAAPAATRIMIVPRQQTKVPGHDHFDIDKQQFT